jgi:flagellar hook-associated protein 3 FlgL
MINNSYSFGMTSQLSKSITNLRERMDTVSNEAVTGRVSDPTKHLSGNIGDAMLSQKALEDIDRDTNRLKLRETRLDLTQQSLTRIQEGLSGISTRAMNAVSFTSEAEWNAISSDARSHLDASLAALRLRHGERYLFSGDATSSSPVPDTETLLAEIETLIADASDGEDLNNRLDAFFDPQTGDWATRLYQGTAEASQDDAVTAVDPAIIKTIRSLAVLAHSGPGDALEGLSGHAEARTNAANLLSTAETEMTDLRAATGIQQQRVSESLDGLAQEKTILSSLFNQMTAKDQYEAAAELKSLEASLEASYMLTARLSQLTLMNFLR